MKLLSLILLYILFFTTNLSAQYDSRKFTYNSTDDKNYINYDQLDELTTKMLQTDKKYFNEDKVAYYTFLDKSQLPDYTDEELHKRILAIPTTIPLKFTPQVGQMIRYFVYNRREYVTRMLTMSQIYFPIFEEVLTEEHLPIELKCLSIVESALNPNAKSRCGATGLWQFMHGTAKHEGMEINTLVDERSDIYTSTEFAAKFLKKLHNLYGDWFLALAAYNAGPGNVNKALRNSGGFDFWSSKHKLPRETQNYVPSFIAMVYVMYYHKDYKLYPGTPKIDFNSTTTELFTEKQSLKYIAEITGSSEDILKQYNPALKKSIIPKLDAGYRVVLPHEVATSLKSKKDLLALDPYIFNPAYIPPAVIDESVLVSETEATPDFNSVSSQRTNSSNYDVVKVVEYDNKKIVHKVQKGENLYQIARLYDVSVEEIRYWNNFNINSKLNVGKNLTIQKNEKIIKPQYVLKSGGSELAKEKQIIYKIKKGETLSSIAKRYNCSLAELMEWNYMTEEKSTVGQEIYLYVKEDYKLNLNIANIQSYTIYEAKNGDTLQSASNRFNIPIEVLKVLNNINENQPLKPGDKIKIPSSL